MRTQTLRLGDSPEPSVEAAATPPAAATAGPARTAAENRAAGEKSTVVAAADGAERGAPVAAPPTPAATTQPKAAAAATGDWTVQLGSFGEEANARRIAQRSGTYGYKADVSSYKDGARTLYRVRVGPQATRAAAEAAASALRAHGIKDARVVPTR